MTIRDLEIFIEVVKTKNMSIAAKNLEISQPTVSHAISQIETEYSIRVFDRISKKLYITDVGLMLYNKACELLNLFDEINFSLQAAAVKHDVSLGVSRNFGTEELISLVSGFESQHKKTNVRIYIENPDKLSQMLADGKIDMAISEVPFDNFAFKEKELFEDELAIITSKDHPLSGKKSVSVSELKEERFILEDFDRTTRETFLSTFLSNRIAVDIKWISNSQETTKALLKDNVAVTLGSKRFFKGEEFSHIEIEGLNIKREFKIYCLRQRHLNEKMKELINYLEENF